MATLTHSQHLNTRILNPERSMNFLILLGVEQIAPFHLNTYSQHLKSGLSGFRMVIFRTQFVSGFCFGSHLVFSIRKPDPLVRL
jgi:hypothetical protein